MFEVIAVYAQTQALGQNFVGSGKIDMDRLSGLGVACAQRFVRPVRVVVFIVPKIVNPGGGRPFGRNEQGARPVRVKGKEIAAGI